MDHHLDLTRAARLAGVTETELLARLARGELRAAEIRITFEELRRVFPELDKSRGSMVQVAGQIKDDVILKALRAKEGVMDMGELQTALRQAQREAAHFKAEAGRWKALLDDLRRMLDELERQVEPGWRVGALLKWLAPKLKAPR
jgi:predicted nuclease with TOPRIM domain